VNVLLLLLLGIQKDIWCAQMPKAIRQCSQKRDASCLFLWYSVGKGNKLVSNSFQKQCIFWHSVRSSMI